MRMCTYLSYYNKNVYLKIINNICTVTECVGTFSVNISSNLIPCKISTTINDADLTIR